MFDGTVNPITGSRFALQGKVVTMDKSFLVYEQGVVYIDKGLIAAVLDVAAPPPPEFVETPLLRTNGTIYPGMIDLNNNLSYDILPLWDVPNKFTNRTQLVNTSEYRNHISVPMRLLSTLPGFSKAVIRYVECKSLLSGVTTSQGIRLSNNNQRQFYYPGIIRNFENTGDPDLPNAIIRRTDVETHKANEFFEQLKKSTCLLLHLSEGFDEQAHAHFSALRMENGDWAISNSLAGIHCLALQTADFQIMAKHGASMVWSPFNNLLLYGATANIRAARYAGLPIGIGSDASPIGSKNLLCELKVAHLVNKALNIGYSERDIIAMATCNPARILKWDHVIGSIEKGKRADLLVIKNRQGDPYKNLVDAPETSINLVVINGIPRYGWKSLMEKFGPGGEAIFVGKNERVLNLNYPMESKEIGGLTLKQATDQLKNMIAKLPELARQAEPDKVEGSPQTQGEGKALWSQLLKEAQLDLDGLTVVDDKRYFNRLLSQVNLPDYIKTDLYSYYQSGKEQGLEVFQGSVQLADQGKSTTQPEQAFPVEFLLQAEPSDQRDVLVTADFSTDSPASGKDLIGIMREVDAFAALIASRSLAPPLSIGLFGEWGSGKTFFMKKLQDSIQKISQQMIASEKMQRDLPFYKHIVQIEFNAWHYMEGNIWASLAEHIIRNLAFQGDAKTPNKTMIDLLESELALRQKVRLVAEQEMTAARAKVELAESELNEARDEFDKKSQSINAMVTAQVSGNILLDEFKPNLEAVTKALRLDVPINNIREMEAALDKVQSVVGDANRFTTPLMHAEDRLTRLGRLMIILVGTGFVSGLLWFVLSRLNLIAIARFFSPMGGLATFLVMGVRWLKQQTQWISAQLTKVKTVEENFQKSKDRVIAQYEEKIQLLEKEKETAKDRLELAENKHKKAITEVVEAQHQIDQTTPTNLLSGFLHDRVGSKDYTRHLGVLALIRRDFETLSNLMEEINWRLSPSTPRDAEILEQKGWTSSKYADLSAEKQDQSKQINRIVLFIDDLDRCSPSKVVDVLQAVHLLLAFPLFVVIVGVDARWIKQSLNTSYRQQLQIDGLHDLEQSGEGLFGKATPDDYLEKIFQIPFWLKPMDQEASLRMIKGLLEESATVGITQALDGNTGGNSSSDKDNQVEQTPDTKEEVFAQDKQPFETAATVAEGIAIDSEGQGDVNPPTNVESNETVIEELASPQKLDLTSMEAGKVSTDLTAQSLHIDEPEEEFMEKLAPLLGRSPRALKRFLNVYRLIKAGLPFNELSAFIPDVTAETSKIGESTSTLPFQIVLFLLAVDTGLPDLARFFFTALKSPMLERIKNRQGKTRKKVMDQQFTWLKKELDLEPLSDGQGELHDQRNKLSDWLNKNGPGKEGGFLNSAANLDPLIGWAEYVSRFSFQVYDIDEETVVETLTDKRD